jgi:hypothetical protein
MLLHWHVNYSTRVPSIGAGRRAKRCNAWLQSHPMRIELPIATWADTAHRVDEDAHTLTLAPQSMPGWVHGALLPDPTSTVRVTVPDTEPVVLSITL